MDADPLTEDVLRFLAEMMGVRVEQLMLSTRLLHDIGVDGDDGSDFIEGLQSRYGVDISEFRFDLHFGPEGGGDPFSCLLFIFFKRLRPKFVPITVADVVEAVRSKKWRPPDRKPV